MKRTICIAMLAMTLVAGCKSEGDEYVGKWENVNNPKDTLGIERNGDGFVIHHRDMMLGDQSIPATLSGETLVITLQGYSPPSFAIDKATGHLTGGDAMFKVEFKKAGT